MYKGRILVVDDDPDLVETICVRLRSRGYETLTAGDGATATRRAVLDHPDLIILDIGLPAGDGHVVAQRLRQISQTVTLPIIFLTGRTTHNDYFKALGAGAARFMTKPFDMDELLTAVDTLIEQQQVEEA